MADDQPGDVRDTLSAIEQRLREFEGDLRSGSQQQESGAGGADDAPEKASSSGTRPPVWLLASIAGGALLVVALIALLASSGGQTQSGDGAPAELAVAPAADGGALGDALAAIKGSRPARGDAAAEACVGTAAAALVVVQPRSRSVGCAGLQPVLTVTTAATGVAARTGASSRQCLRASQVAAQLRRAPTALTETRAAQSRKAAAAAAERARSRGATAAAVLAAQRSAAARAGARFDSKRGLRLAAVRNRSGRCTAPTAANLHSGAYPLAVRVQLLARPAEASGSDVMAAAATLRKALGGAVPVEAAVSRR
ncbi:MAG: hypothetical protein F2813_05925 [Actinobacteria bacterium]|uniref:Unannotated protein n=1 Tax=freshwater metagenome TaxID=449393 RepID=A0A6J5ZXG0_9ZZZZ|nr:hypothetical protein [Actinomycetota bacterium]